MSRLERIVSVLGGVLLDGGTRALIPGPGHSAKDRSVSLMETEQGRLLIHCFSARDDWRDVRRALEQRGLLGSDGQTAHVDAAPRERVLIVQPDSEARLARARAIWEEGRALAGTVAERYLIGRAIPQPLTRSGALRFHPGMTSLEDRGRRPALLAAISSAAGELQGVQVTLLSKHGAAKAPVETPRRVIGKLIHGAVRLADEAETLVIGEGVETVLSASAIFGFPAWAALSAHNLALFEPPRRVRALIVAADTDEAGRAAASALGARLKSRMRVEQRAPDGAEDWNSWLGARDG